MRFGIRSPPFTLLSSDFVQSRSAIAPSNINAFPPSLYCFQSRAPFKQISRNSAGLYTSITPGAPLYSAYCSSFSTSSAAYSFTPFFQALQGFRFSIFVESSERLIFFTIFAAYGADFMQFGPYTRPAEPNQPPGFWFQPPPPIRQDKSGEAGFLFAQTFKDSRPFRPRFLT